MAHTIAILCLLGLFLQPASSADMPKGFVYKPEHIQLTPTMAEVRENGAKAGHYPVSIFLKVANEEVAYELCQNAPRLRDIVVRLFYDTPLTHKDLPVVKKSDKGTPPPKRLRHYEVPVRKAVNKALGAKIAEKAFVFAGAFSMGEGMMARLPFASSQGCRTVEAPKKEGDKE
ncbi:MAG: hypothetical protein OQJ87_03295 [Rhodospirillales bacterium]|nr:hypothetical protein [Rhodospirillales bacterium]